MFRSVRAFARFLNNVKVKCDIHARFPVQKTHSDGLVFRFRGKQHDLCHLPKGSMRFTGIALSSSGSSPTHRTCSVFLVSRHTIYEVLNMKKVLVTLASGTLATGVMRGLRAGDEEIYVIGVESSRYHIHQSDADELHLVPRASDPRFVEVLVDIATKAKADFVWPMHDAEIERISAARSEIPIRTWVPPLEVCRTSRDKLATAMRLAEAEVPAPRTMLISTAGDLTDAYETLGPELWLRARSGAGCQGRFPIDEPRTRKPLARYQRWLGHIPGC